MPPCPSTSCGNRKSRTSKRNVTKRDVELEAQARFPGQPQHRFVERAARASTAKMSEWTMVCSVNFSLAWIGDHKQREHRLPGLAGREVMLLIEGGEGIFQAELHRRARDQHLDAEVLRGIERQRAPIAVRRRQHVGRVNRQPRQLEAVALQEIAALHALAPPAALPSPSRQVSACRARFGLVLALGVGVSVAFRRRCGRSLPPLTRCRRKPVGRLVRGRCLGPRPHGRRRRRLFPRRSLCRKGCRWGPAVGARPGPRSRE